MVPRRLPGIGELWKRALPRADLAARIEQVHQPYHSCLTDELAALRARWGAALLIDLHSMPSLAAAGGGAPARIVLGDRFGASCSGALVASAFAFLASEQMASRHGNGQRWLAAHNRPYAGGYGLERHAAPSRGIHAVQIEIDRACYLDSRLVEPGEGFAGVVAMLVGLVRRLAGDVAVLGAGTSPNGPIDWDEAAE